MKFDHSNKYIAVKQYLEAYENLEQKRAKLEKALGWKIELRQAIISDDIGNAEELVTKINEISDKYDGIPSINY